MTGVPRLARAILRLHPDRALREEFERDLEELFVRRMTVEGRLYAARRYWCDVASFFTPRRRPPARQPLILVEERGRLMSGFWFDVRQVVRSVRRQPGFFAVAALTLAVGFAAHLSAFSLVDRLLLAPPPHVHDPARLVRLHIDRTDRGNSRFLWFQTPFRSYHDLRAAGGLFDGMAAYRQTTASVGSGTDARQLSLVFADEQYFPLLGVSPRLGRVFGADENRPPSGTPVVVLSHDYWQSQFAGASDVLGRSLRIGSTTYTVVGVMPRGFTADLTDPIDAWAPLYAGAHELPASWTTSLLFRSVSVVARVPAAATREATAESAATVYRRSVESTPAADAMARVVLAPLSPGRTQTGELNQSGRIAVWIEGVALLVLLVALANVVNLQMSRAVQMRRELAVRVALGAGRGRLAFTLLLEMLFIAIVSALAGLLLASWTATSLQQLLLPGSPGPFVSLRVVAVAAATLLGVALAGATVASLQLRMEAVGERLKTGRGGEGFRRERLRQTLLVAQVVVSALLLVGAGLFMRSIQRLGQLQFGHDHDRVLVVTVPFRAAGYSTAAIEAFYDRALVELSRLPGVERVAAAQSMPFSPSQSTEMFVRGLDRLPFDGRRYPTFYTVTPTFFETMGMKLLRGRPFTDADRAGAPPVLIVEDALAKTLWPTENPIGKCIALTASTAPCREVVGVVSNTRRFVATAESALRYYVPLAQRVVAANPQALFLRTAGEPRASMEPVRSALLTIDNSLPFARMRTLDEMSEPEKRPWRLGNLLFVLFGAAALLVATAGVYALLSFTVTQRSREIGVRLALGATPWDALRLVVLQSQRWIVIGLGAGLAIAAMVGRFIQPVLFETSPHDAAVFSGTAGVLIVVSLIASMVPAIRASRVDPNVALRTE